MASSPTGHYHNKVTRRHYLLLPTDRDSGHYQLPLHCLSRLLSGGVVGFRLEGKRNFRQRESGEKDTRFYTFNRCSQGRNCCSQSYMRHAVGLIFSRVVTDLPVLTGKELKKRPLINPSQSHLKFSSEGCWVPCTSTGRKMKIKEINGVIPSMLILLGMKTKQKYDSRLNHFC